MAAALAAVRGGPGRRDVRLFGARGRPLHRAFAEHGSLANGEVIDAVANIWTVKAFSARRRERDRLAHEFAVEAGTQTP